ncbi:MAG: hypothetical protein HN817_02530 [Porticoccaceae bacterium]|jgi:hypothetical protein|nr:hypothetical protein [Porticoccaceae bacterium]MBT5577191.1 hypothetical protein [Porticoccaceae bacterium]MBT7374785.1 hypothetical protein [Porticoccaceae bacterium]
MNTLTKFTGIGLFLIVLSGCTATTTIDEYRPSTEAIDLNSDEKVVILGRRDAGHYETDREFIQCVAGKMKGADISVLPEQTFIDSIYPWFEPRTAPKGLPRLKRLMQDPSVKAQVDRQSVRYLVWLDGSTETLDQGGSISCAVGPGGGGCFGFAQWDKLSVYEAIVWDMTNLQEMGRLRVDSEGTSYLIGAVAPIPLLTPVKSDACSSLGNQLKSFFSAP